MGDISFCIFTLQKWGDYNRKKLDALWLDCSSQRVLPLGNK